MLVRRSLLLIGFFMASAVFGLVLSSDSWAQDVRHMCSEKYQAAKAAGTLNGETWPQFYSKCTAEAKGSPPAAAAAPAAAAPLDVRRMCSEKYQAAKAAGTLAGEAWPQFYSKCTAEAKGSPPAAPAAVAPAPGTCARRPRCRRAATPGPAPAPAPVVAAPAVTPPPVNPLKKPATKPVAPAVAATPGTAVYPSAISPAHASEKPGIARRKTCLDQYNANKATNANGGLKWVQKGGGYYSECTKRLKG